MELLRPWSGCTGLDVWSLSFPLLAPADLSLYPCVPGQGSTPRGHHTYGKAWSIGHYPEAPCLTPGLCLASGASILECKPDLGLDKQLPIGNPSEVLLWGQVDSREFRNERHWGLQGQRSPFMEEQYDRDLPP